MKNSSVTINTETGEVLEVQKHYNIKVPVNEFYLTYINKLSGVFNIKQGIDIKILIYMCSVAEMNTGEVKLPTQSREILCKSIGISGQQLTNGLSNLKKLELISGERGLFIINPAIFWKGTEESRQKALKEGMNVIINFKSEEGN